jgi:N-formylglutamate deformylase
VVRPNNAEQVYDRKLGIADILHRIDNYYKPYHRALQETLDRVHDIYARVYLLDCHSMPSAGHTGLADIVLGNRDDTTCARDFMAIVGDAFAARGYSVAYNHPYKGVEIVRKFSSPREHRYALQIEINRALYMNETTLEKTAGFDSLRNDLEPVLRQIIDYSYVK